MRKLSLKYMLLVLSILLCVTSHFSNAQDPHMDGVFGAPQFFKFYDKKFIDEIAATPNAKYIKVTYPRQLKQLASQIRDELAKKTSVKIYSEEVNLVDTTTTKYIHDSVMVVVYFR